MQLKSFLVAASMVASAFAKRTCGTDEPTEVDLQVAQDFKLMESSARLAGNGSRAAGPIQINVYWHVVASSQSVSGGYLTQATLDEQLAVLNTAYAPHDISFVEAGADWTVNSNWAADRAEVAMKNALRKGTYADLNVYLGARRASREGQVFQCYWSDPIFDAASAIIKSDSAITPEVKEAHKQGVAALEDIPENEKDGHPRSDGKVLNLVHPSLWPLVFEKSRIVADKRILLRDTLAASGRRGVIPVPKKRYPNHQSSDDLWPVKYQWLPCDIDIEEDHELHQQLAP
ncbi:metalloprotease [Colletotrichum gloeosporioides Cg-14]|uniref:Metalloprotease n=1 Tax=Colletotrichum gloeosporioides (strain Cg-14) TaxID=1237896 RepID=T0KG10_COLGC|nr:metalloprotease [Colletotrichum gloeosporioides Cg-14]